MFSHTIQKRTIRTISSLVLASAIVCGLSSTTFEAEALSLKEIKSEGKEVNLPAPPINPGYSFYDLETKDKLTMEDFATPPPINPLP